MRRRRAGRGGGEGGEGAAGGAGAAGGHQAASEPEKQVSSPLGSR